MKQRNVPGRDLDEDDIKTLVLTKLYRDLRIGRKSVIASEYPLRSLGVRADLAIREGKFIGIEVKSNLDKLGRLERQLPAYSLVFDETILVLASRHIAQIDPYITGFEVWELRSDGALHVIKRPKSKTKKDGVFSYANLMTQAELRKFAHGQPASAADSCLKKIFLNSFSAKFGQTSRLFWSQVGLAIERNHLDLLSRFSNERQKTQDITNKAAQRWDQWLTELQVLSNELSDQSLQLSSVS